MQIARGINLYNRLTGALIFRTNSINSKTNMKCETQRQKNVNTDLNLRWAHMSDGIPSDICAQRWFRSDCVSAQSDQNPHWVHFGLQWFKVSTCTCVQRLIWSVWADVWYEYSLGALIRNYVSSRYGIYDIQHVNFALKLCESSECPDRPAHKSSVFRALCLSMYSTVSIDYVSG